MSHSRAFEQVRRIAVFFPAVALAVSIATNGCSKDESDAPNDGGSEGEGGMGGRGGSGTDEVTLPSHFDWTSTGPLIEPVVDATHPIVSVKDPTVVFFEGEWHVFATTADENQQWSLVYLSFSDWSEAGDAELHYLDENPALTGYHAAPQVFYFAPEEKWYLIFQSQQPQYSTTDDLSDPDSWTTPRNFFPAEPAIVTENKGEGTWLDYWVICDDDKCHLFFTDDNGHFYRSETDIDDFPENFGDPEIVIDGTKSTVFEGSATYRVGDTGQYLTLIEAFGEAGERYYRSFVSDRLDGEWTPLAASFDNPFAARSNVTFSDGDAWTQDISHGELLRDGYDQTLTIDPGDLRLLYQGVEPSETGVEYSQLPYRLALLTYTETPTKPIAPPMGPSVCDDATVDGMESIATFESGALSGWWASYDDTDGSTNEPLAVQSPGANDTSHALHFVGSGHLTWGANVGITFGCTDTSSFDGVSLYAKGTSGSQGEVHVIAQVAAALPLSSGGDCFEDCYSHPRTTIELTEEWTRYDLPFSDFQQPDWGVEATYEGTIMGLALESSGPDFDVWIDEVMLYPGTNSGGGGAGGAGQ